MQYTPKPEFIERINILLNNEEDAKKFFETAKTLPKKSIRVNTLKISPEKLIKKLEEKNWKLHQPFPEYPEIIQIQNELEPGELGKAIEHILGYFYVQEITSMMPIIALQPNVDDTLLDLCASPGSKTTQAAAIMQNKGVIIANDVSISRISILSANLEKTGVTNAIVTRHDGINLCKKLKKLNFNFDKILVDAPCSGEGNIRTSPRTYLEWSEPMIESMSRKQKKLAEAALEILKENRIMVYSTCTHAPEENEEVVQHLIDKFNIEILEIKLPLKTRQGITEWKGKKFSGELKKAVRIYPHDNDMEGFFLCKMRKINNERKK